MMRRLSHFPRNLRNYVRLTIATWSLFSLFLAVDSRYFNKYLREDLKNPDLLRSPALIHQLENQFERTSVLSSAADNTQARHGQLRNGIIDPRHLWNEFSVYVDPEFNYNETVFILNLLNQLYETITCLPFVIRDSSVGPPNGTDYVHINKGVGCTASATGRQGGVQYLTFESPGCFEFGKMMHEMIHAIGLHHEQSRPDRDDYVTIQWENIEAGKEHFFEKLNESDVSTFGVPYNPRSIMHSNPFNYSSNGLPTMIAKNGEPVGSVGELMETDVLKLRRMYNCSSY